MVNFIANPRQLWLPNQEVHVWQANLNVPDSIIEKLFILLSEDEQQRAKRFHFPRHMRRFTVARAFLRKILGHYLATSPESLQFAYTDHGKPYIEMPCNKAELCFNLSHSEEIALYAITQNQAVGIDIEYLQRNTVQEDLARRFFAPAEYQAMQQLPVEQRSNSFFAIWTRKEAFIKAIGLGLYFPLNKFTVSASPEEPAVLLSVDEEMKVPQLWTMQTFKPQADYMASFAVEGEISGVHFWQFSGDDFD